MSFEGTIVNGTVVFDVPPALEDGTRVDVLVQKPVETPKPTLLGLLKLAGRIKDMPADFTEEHDHYIHGTPRRKPKEGE
jgi:hypothetical protein